MCMYQVVCSYLLIWQYYTYASSAVDSSREVLPYDSRHIRMIAVINVAAIDHLPCELVAACVYRRGPERAVLSDGKVHA